MKGFFDIVSGDCFIATFWRCPFFERVQSGSTDSLKTKKVDEKLGRGNRLLQSDKPPLYVCQRIRNQTKIATR